MQILRFIRIFKLLKNPRHRFHRPDSLREINSVVELILGDIDSHVKEMKISELSLSYVVCGEGHTPIDKEVLTHEQYGSCRQGMKSRFLL